MLSKKKLKSVKFKTLASSMLIDTIVIVLFTHLSDIFKINITRELFSLDNIYYLVIYFFVGIGVEDYRFRSVLNKQLQEYDTETLLWRLKKEKKQIQYFLLAFSVLAVFTIPFISLIFWVIYPLALFALLPYCIFCLFLIAELRKL